MEILLKDKTLKGSIISSIEKQNPDEGDGPTKPAAEGDKMEERILAALEKFKIDDRNYSINALAAHDLRNKLQRGGHQKSFRPQGGGKGGGARQSGFNKGTGVMLCWYCNIPGHMQAACMKRQKEGGAWVSKRSLVIHAINQHQPPDVQKMEEDVFGGLHQDLN